mmetsp:Transcript_3018/g.7036  ORF Transcript_3018/g.7036 Transcript_3018/m.7036 type:complete len:104 (-) Transcript_3018:19-330(-)
MELKTSLSSVETRKKFSLPASTSTAIVQENIIFIQAAERKARCYTTILIYQLILCGRVLLHPGLLAATKTDVAVEKILMKVIHPNCNLHICGSVVIESTNEIL